MNRLLRIYADTSVFGGVFDPEFEKFSAEFFERICRRPKQVELVVSSLVVEELRNAPREIVAHFESLAPLISEVEVDEVSYELQQAYIRANVVSPRWEADALHVAVATVCQCNAIVSWNFKHIVNFQRIPWYNALNEENGFSSIAIHTPPEIRLEENDETF